MSIARQSPEAIVKQICPLCGLNQIGLMLDYAPDYVTNEVFQIRRCDGCGLCFTAPSPSDMTPYYPQSYRSYGGIVSSVLGRLYRLRVRYWTRIFGRSGKVLEMGCGAGVMLKAFRDAGWQVKGIERTPDAAAYGRVKFGLDISTGGWESLPESETFDLIILFQVLEHLDDPVGSVQECFRRLRPGGALILGVPNIASWQARFGREGWQHLDVPRHLFHFSPTSLTRLLKAAGFEDIQLTFTSFEHDPFGWVQTIENRIFPRRNVLLRYLMRLEPLGLQTVAAMLLAGLLALPSLVLSPVSWVVGKGAILSALARTAQSKPMLGNLPCPDDN